MRGACALRWQGTACGSRASKPPGFISGEATKQLRQIGHGGLRSMHCPFVDAVFRGAWDVMLRGTLVARWNAPHSRQSCLGGLGQRLQSLSNLQVASATEPGREELLCVCDASILLASSGRASAGLACAAGLRAPRRVIPGTSGSRPGCLLAEPNPL